MISNSLPLLNYPFKCCQRILSMNVGLYTQEELLKIYHTLYQNYNKKKKIKKKKKKKKKKNRILHPLTQGSVLKVK